MIRLYVGSFVAIVARYMLVTVAQNYISKDNGIWHYYFCNIDRIRAVQQWLDSLVTEEESGVDIP